MKWKWKKHWGTHESLVTQEPKISKTLVEHEEQVNNARVNGLVNEQNLMKVL